MPVAWLLQDGVADYLKSLPIPRSFGDIKDLSLKDYLHLTFFFGATGGKHIRYDCDFIFLQPLLTFWDRKSALLTDRTLPSNSPAIRSSIPSSKIYINKIIQRSIQEPKELTARLSTADAGSPPSSHTVTALTTNITRRLETTSVHLLSPRSEYL